MLAEVTLEKLYAMKLNGLAEAWQEQQQQPQSSDLSFDERLAMLVERQWIWKENRALVTRLKFAQAEAVCLPRGHRLSPPAGVKACRRRAVGLLRMDPPSSPLPSSPVPPAWANPTWPAPWRTKPAGSDSAPSTSTDPNSSAP